ncbi:hypothetical protein SCHPADRAFT_7637 [Schizopora paradoxa]|uniref:Uncharacterized protein n=1 Tax=Schizopora paradoxa TaxID=27342 RepID=A0A0H2S9G6_9AGAM|nr:hypothetical protein SCHPADRAFT_7637 [Schizopora paradoxa]
MKWVWFLSSKRHCRLVSRYERSKIASYRIPLSRCHGPPFSAKNDHWTAAVGSSALVMLGRPIKMQRNVRIRTNHNLIFPSSIGFTERACERECRGVTIRARAQRNTAHLHLSEGRMSHDCRLSRDVRHFVRRRKRRYDNH